MFAYDLDLVTPSLLLIIGFLSFRFIYTRTESTQEPTMLPRRGGARIPFRRNPLIPPPEPRPAIAPVAKAKKEEIERPATPEPSGPSRGGLSSLLGGWWGRK